MHVLAGCRMQDVAGAGAGKQNTSTWNEIKCIYLTRAEKICPSASGWCVWVCVCVCVGACKMNDACGSSVCCTNTHTDTHSLPPFSCRFKYATSKKSKCLRFCTRHANWTCVVCGVCGRCVCVCVCVCVGRECSVPGFNWWMDSLKRNLLLLLLFLLVHRPWIANGVCTVWQKRR